MSGTRTRRPRQQDPGRNDQDPGDNAPPPSRGWPVPSGPNSVPTAGPRGVPAPIHAPSRPKAEPEGIEMVQYWEPADSGPAELVSVPPSSTTPHTRRPPGLGGAISVRARLWTGPHRGNRPVLLRKEVIQPHLPVRLPCYDFVPIADPAFDGSLHKGWATGFGRYRLS